METGFKRGFDPAQISEVSPGFPLKVSTFLRRKLEGRFLSDTTALVMSVTPRISSLSMLAAGFSAGMRQSFAQTVIGAHKREMYKLTYIKHMCASGSLRS